MFKVEVSADAREFILKKAEAVTVEAMMYCGGCFGKSMLPDVLAAEPTEPQ